MQENKHFLSLGICHRLFNFVKNIVIARGRLKRVTLGGHPPPPHGSTTTVPVDDSLMNETVSILEDQQLSDDIGDKIPIQFKETDELECWTPVDALGYSVHVSKENNSPADNTADSQAPPLMSSEQKDQAKGINIGKSSVEIEAIATEDEAEEAKKKQKEEETTQMKAPPVTHAKPRFSSVLADINEISEAYIRSRKEEMEKTKL
ncbi:hypothetical protein FH972_006084 [Carpinus fangiana]|uniref:Uncharacterized protein n=1 Tax=Carpinus fangiana TaxID=176857 RepID=A0A5N6QTK8_9ROSI|nr:hypothetical protein FH972_006084 [Carpinus fangiana]